MNPLLAVTCQIEYFRLNNSPSASQYTSCQLSYYHSCSCRLKERKLKITSSLCLVLFDLLSTPFSVPFFFFSKRPCDFIRNEMSHRSRRCVRLSNALKSRRRNDPFGFFFSFHPVEKLKRVRKQLCRSPRVALN